MAEVKKELVAGCLYPRQPEMKLVNVKFFRGSRESISPDEFRSELRSIADQLQGERVKGSGEAPRSLKSKVNIREYLAEM